MVVDVLFFYLISIRHKTQSQPPCMSDLDSYQRVKRIMGGKADGAIPPSPPAQNSLICFDVLRLVFFLTWNISTLAFYNVTQPSHSALVIYTLKWLVML